MMELQWNDSLKIGHTEIDRQHKELFRRVNDLIAAINEGKGGFEVGATIKFLEDYVITHFSAEERLMTATKYPKLQAHRVQHEEFKKKLFALKRLFAAHGASMEILVQVHDQLGSWLTTHIPNADMEMANCLKGKEADTPRWEIKPAV